MKITSAEDWAKQFCYRVGLDELINGLVDEVKKGECHNPKFERVHDAAPEHKVDCGECSHCKAISLAREQLGKSEQQTYGIAGKSEDVINK